MEWTVIVATLTAAITAKATGAIVSFIVTGIVRAQAYMNAEERSVWLPWVNGVISIIGATVIVWQTGDIAPLQDAVGVAVGYLIQWIVTAATVYIGAYLTHKAAKSAYKR